MTQYEQLSRLKVGLALACFLEKGDLFARTVADVLEWVEMTVRAPVIYQTGSSDELWAEASSLAAIPDLEIGDEEGYLDYVFLAWGTDSGHPFPAVSLATYGLPHLVTMHTAHRTYRVEPEEARQAGVRAVQMSLVNRGIGRWRHKRAKS